MGDIMINKKWKDDLAISANDIDNYDEGNTINPDIIEPYIKLIDGTIIEITNYHQLRAKILLRDLIYEDEKYIIPIDKILYIVKGENK